LFQKAQYLEKKGLWRKAAQTLNDILVLDPRDSHSYLALARLQARRFPNSTSATIAFHNGTSACPNSVHLWQAWAVYEQNVGRTDRAKELFGRALELDPYNPYVCHAYGLLLEKNNVTAAVNLWQHALEKKSTAALVCSLGTAYIAQEEYGKARKLYAEHLNKIPSDRERTEVALASAWLEERYFSNINGARQLLTESLRNATTSASLVQVAMARFEGRRKNERVTPYTSEGGIRKNAERRKLEQACEMNIQDSAADGRVFNALASIEVKARRLKSARQILNRGLELHPKDYSLLQAAGKVEERMGNYTGARTLYRSSLCIQPSAPCLVAIALLELHHPTTKKTNFALVKQLFEEALLIDPRHAPAYNAYARCVFEQEDDERQARSIFERGVRAKCPDAASLYHGFAKLELALGNIDSARKLLIEGRNAAKRQEIGKDSPHRERALFLMHTLGMLELNSNRIVSALEVFSDGVTQYGNSSQLLLGAALCEVRLGNVDKARILFEKSVINDRRHAHAWQAWGVLEMKTGNWKAAKTLFQCGIKNVPRHGPLWQAYAVMESRLGNVTEARALFEKGINQSPNSSSLYQGWASLELREGNSEDAKVLITKALTLDKHNGAGWLIASEIEQRLGNRGLSMLLLRRGVECSPSNPSLYRALGEGLLGEGKINEAREILEKGLEMDPTHAPLYHSLAELEARVCNVQGLAKLHQRAAAMFNSNIMEPSQNSSDAWASKIKAARLRNVPIKVTALAESASSSDAIFENDADVSSSSLLDDLSSQLLVGGISNLLTMDDEEL
jgi:tetratricopeptide (TPR) repeat protein